MATRYANVQGIVFPDALGDRKTLLAIVTFDLANIAYNGGTPDTVQIGGGGYEDGIATTSTLATMIQNRLRNGETVTLYSVMTGPPGLQAAATSNGPTIYATGSLAVSGGNVTTISLENAISSGSQVTTAASYFDKACSVVVLFQMTGW